MVKTIILVGCGNVGSRHLQAIARLSYSIQVYVIEPNDNAQNLAKLRLKEITYDETNHEFFWYKSVNELKKTGDLVVVATNSIGRVDLILELINKGNTRFLIEKIVCQSVSEYNRLLEKINESNGKGWVNTTPRCFKSYHRIKELLQGEKVICFSVKANSKSGLGTNAVHYIDLFSWLVEDNKIILNGESLLDELLPNKRGQNLKEFSGTITGTVKNGSSLSITFLPNLSDEIILEISTNRLKIIINETNNKITTYGSVKDYNSEFNFEHVSSTSIHIIDDILKNDKCLLPTLNELFNAHSELFRIFNAHINKLSKEDVELCPIT